MKGIIRILVIASVCMISSFKSTAAEIKGYIGFDIDNYSSNKFYTYNHNNNQKIYVKNKKNRVDNLYLKFSTKFDEKFKMENIFMFGNNGCKQIKYNNNNNIFRSDGYKDISLESNIFYKIIPELEVKASISYIIPYSFANEFSHDNSYMFGFGIRYRFL